MTRHLLLSFKPPLRILYVRNSVVPHSTLKYSKWFEFCRVPEHSLGGVQSQNSVIHLLSPSITFLRISWEGAEIVQRISEASTISARYLLEPLSFPLFRPSFDSDRSWSQLGHHTSVTHWWLTISHVISVCITWLIVALYLFFVLNKSWILTVSISLKCHKISCHTTESIFLY